ncbi:MAG: hypothetical protein ACLGIN_00245 [Candidatus Sericytochromatia bacterium]
MSRPSSLLLALAALAGAGVLFYLHQNARPTIGGSISGPGALWLTFALASLFLIPAWLASDPTLAPALRRLYAIHLGFWALRAALELPLMYALQAWRPAYGIAHDCLAIALVAGAAWRWRRAIGAAAGPADRAARRFVPVLLAAIACECAFAWLFNHATGGQTAAWWFPDDAPRFRLLNWLTALACAVLLPLTAVSMRSYWRSGRGGDSRRLLE